MGTRFYLPSAGVAPVSPPFESVWAFGGTQRFNLVTETTGTPIVQLSAAETAPSTTNVRWAQFVSAPLAAQAINGTMTLGVAYSGNYGGALRCIAKVVSNDGATTHGMLQNFVDPQGVGGFFDGRIMTAALQTVDAPANSRLVIELGYLTNNTTGSSRAEALLVGDNHFSGSYQRDLNSSHQGVTLYTGGDRDARPWIDFSKTLFPQQVKVSKFHAEALLKPYEAQVSRVMAEGLLKPIDAKVSRVAPEVLHRPVKPVLTPRGRPIYILLPTGWKQLTVAPKYL